MTVQKFRDGVRLTQIPNPATHCKAPFTERQHQCCINSEMTLVIFTHCCWSRLRIVSTLFWSDIVFNENGKASFTSSRSVVDAWCKWALNTVRLASIYTVRDGLLDCKRSLGLEANCVHKRVSRKFPGGCLLVWPGGGTCSWGAPGPHPRGKWGGSGPGPHVKGEIEGDHVSRPIPKGEIDGGSGPAPPMATAAAGTHPTGMHSCCFCLVKCACFLPVDRITETTLLVPKIFPMSLKTVIEYWKNRL